MDYPRTRQRMMTSVEENVHSRNIDKSLDEASDSGLQTRPQKKQLSRRGGPDDLSGDHGHKHGHSRHASFHQNKSTRDKPLHAKDQSPNGLRTPRPLRQQSIEKPLNVTFPLGSGGSSRCSTPSSLDDSSYRGTTSDLKSRDSSSAEGSPSSDTVPILSESSDGQVTATPRPPASDSAQSTKQIVVTVEITPLPSPLPSTPSSSWDHSGLLPDTTQPAIVVSASPSIDPLIPLVVSAASIEASITHNPLLPALLPSPSSSSSKPSLIPYTSSPRPSAIPHISASPSSNPKSNYGPTSSKSPGTTTKVSQPSASMASSLTSSSALNSTSSSSHSSSSSSSSTSSQTLPTTNLPSSSMSSSSSLTSSTPVFGIPTLPSSSPIVSSTPSFMSSISTPSTSATLLNPSLSSRNHTSTTLATLLSRSSSLSSTSHTTITSSRSTSTHAATSGSSSSDTFVGGGASGTATSSSASGTASAASITQDSNSGSNVSTPAVIGGVLGGLAGLSVLLIGALFALRWYRRRQNSNLVDLGSSDPPSGAGTGTNELSQVGPGLGASMGAAGAAGFMQRLSQRSTPPPPASGERGFQRISGRKLPSQFSPGAEGPVAAAAGGSHYISGSSAYPSGGTFLSDATTTDPFVDPPPPSPRGPNLPTAVAAVAAAGPEGRKPDMRERYMPGPARTPVLHQVGDPRASHLAAPSTPTFPRPPGYGSPRNGSPGPSFGRASSFDSSRASRFTEDVV